MKTTNKNKILTMTIANLGLPNQSLSYLIEIAFQSRFKQEYQYMQEGKNLIGHNQESLLEMYKKPYEDATGQKTSKEWVNDLMVGEVIDAWNSYPYTRAYFVQNSWRNSPKANVAMKNFMQRLIQLGMTKLDWPHLYHLDTIQISMPKRKWLDQSVYLLGTLTPKALCDLSDSLEKPSVQITIRELLNWKSTWKWCRWEKSKQTTIVKLRELGFTSVDGPFIPLNLSEHCGLILNSLMTEEKLTKSFAKKVIEIALHRDWIR